MKKYLTLAERIAKQCYNWTLLAIIVLSSVSFNAYANDGILASTSIEQQSDLRLYGCVNDTDGNPIGGVVVSDGYDCVSTNESGEYQLMKHPNASYVFISTPAYCIASTTAFYRPLQEGVTRYDFQLERSAAQDQFTLLALGDSQVKTDQHLKRFVHETMADIQSNFGERQSQSIVAVTLGDNVGDSPQLFDTLRTAMNSANLPMFATIGNHDKVPEKDKTLPRNAHLYMNTFGPLNYSFNRGKVHIVCLDNIIYNDARNYVPGFTDEQVAWLEKDLSFVPKDNMIILCYHIPIRNNDKLNNRNRLLSLLEQFPNRRLMCGHTHYHRYYAIKEPIEIREDIVGTACGSWWRSTINGDGTPNGYAVYEFDGNQLVNQYYKSVNYDKSFQMRLYMGDTKFGGKHAKFSFDKGEKTLIANIWNADDDWAIYVYEDDVLKGQMKKMTGRPQDAWAKGYHIGILNRNPDGNSQPAFHMYSYTLDNPDTEIRVEAIDRYGNKYRQDEIEMDAARAASYE